MSNRRRSKGDKDDNPFAVSDVQAPTFESVDRSGYGGPLMGKLDKHISAKPIPIFDIQADPTQPRRVIPHHIRAVWDGTLENLFGTWMLEIDHERDDQSFSIQELLLARAADQEELDGVGDPAHAGPLEASLLKIIDLAASIKRDGLTNPITVTNAPVQGYFLETGERRWLAYLLLSQISDDKQWLKIPARVMDGFSVWRQAGENNIRADLNAISKARQFAILLMALYQDQGATFIPHATFVEGGGHDQDYYSQVADEKAYRVPRGKGDLLLNAMGFRERTALKRHRDLLKLAPEVWTLADDWDCPESVLRSMIDLPADLQLKAIEAWKASKALPPPPSTEPRKVASGNLSTAPWEKPFRKMQTFTPRQLAKLNDEEKARFSNHLDALEAWIRDMRDHL